jgi:hypothetical protein
MIDFACPKCSQAIHVSGTAAGNRGQCKSCGEAVTVPAAKTFVLGTRQWLAVMASAVLASSFMTAIVTSNAMRKPTSEDVQRDLAKAFKSPLPGNSSDTESETPAKADSVVWNSAGLSAMDKAVSIKLESAVIGKAVLSSMGSSVQSKDDWLQISFTVRNLSDSRILNYSGYDLEIHGRGSHAKICDDLGNQYSIHPHGLGSDIAGQQTYEELYPGKTLKDLIVCRIPVEKAKLILIELPQNAYSDTAGVLRFKIPVSQIKPK